MADGRRSLEDFSEAIREAFRLEYDCIEDQALAPIIGVKPARVSQILNHPRTLHSETVRRVIEPLQSTAYKQRILEAWQVACFGQNVEDRSEKASEPANNGHRTLALIDDLCAKNNPDRALVVASRALAAEKDMQHKRAIYLRIFELYKRLDKQANMLRMADGCRRFGERTQSQWTIAQGLHMQFQALGRIDGIPIKTILGLRNDLIDVAGCLKPVSARQRSKRTAYQRTANAYLSVFLLKYHEVSVGRRNALAGLLEQLRIGEGDQISPATRRLSLEVQARVLIAMGSFVEAEELLDLIQPPPDGPLRGRLAHDMIRASLLDKRGSRDEAIDLLQNVCLTCETTRSLFYYRVAARSLGHLYAGSASPP